MIKISIAGTFLDFAEETKIAFEDNSNIFDLGKSEGLISLPFFLPSSKKNDKFFENLHHHQSRKKFESYSDCSISYKGDTLFFGTLKVKLSNKKGYETTFLGGILAISEKKDTLISQILDYTDLIERDNEALRYPKFVSKNFIVNNPNSEVEPSPNMIPNGFVSDTSEFWNDWALIPMLKVNEGLHRLFSKLAYKFEKNAVFEKLLFFSLKEPDLVVSNMDFSGLKPAYSYQISMLGIKTSYMMPDISLSKFLELFRKTFCCFFDFNNFKKTAEIRFIRDVLTAAATKDWTKKAEKYYQKEDNSKKGIRFTFSLKDDIFKENPTIEGFEKFFVKTKNEIPVLESNQTALVESEGVFYKKISMEFLGANLVLPYSFAVDDLVVGESESTHEAPVSPLVKQNNFWFTAKANIRHNNIWLRLELLEEINFPIQKIKFRNSKNYLNDFDYEVVSMQKNILVLSIPSEMFKDKPAEDGVEFAYFFESNEFLPTTQNKTHRTRRNEINDKPINSFLVDLGVTEQNIYNFSRASSDGYDGTRKINEFSFRWYGSDGLFETFFSDWATIQNKSKKTTMLLNLEIVDLLNSKWGEKIRIKDMDYIIIKKNYELTKNGLSPTICEMVAMDFVPEYKGSEPIDFDHTINIVSIHNAITKGQTIVLDQNNYSRTIQAPLGAYIESLSIDGNAQSLDLLAKKFQIDLSNLSNGGSTDITVIFANLSMFTINSQKTGSGTITHPDTVYSGDTLLVPIKPATGFRIEKILLNGIELTDFTEYSYDLEVKNITDNQNIEVFFTDKQKKFYTITYICDSNLAIITAPDEVEAGKPATIQIATISDKAIKRILVNGTPLNTFNPLNHVIDITEMSQNILIWVDFEETPITTFGISSNKIIQGQYGGFWIRTPKLDISHPTFASAKTQIDFILEHPDTVAQGNNFTFTVRPPEGFLISKILENKTSLSFTPEGHTLTKIANKNYFYEVEFTKKMYPITSTIINEAGGSVVLTSQNPIEHGMALTAQINPKPNFRIKNLKLNGQNIVVNEPTKSYLLQSNNVQIAQDIEVEFELIEWQIRFVNQGTGVFSVLWADGSTLLSRMVANRSFHDVQIKTIPNQSYIKSITGHSPALLSFDEKTSTLLFSDIKQNYQIFVETGRLYIVQKTAGTGGSIIGVDFAKEGTNETFRIKPAANYKIKSISLNGSPIIGFVETSEYFLNVYNVSAEIIIEAVFEALPSTTTYRVLNNLYVWFISATNKWRVTSFSPNNPAIPFSIINIDFDSEIQANAFMNNLAIHPDTMTHGSSAGITVQTPSGYEFDKIVIADILEFNEDGYPTIITNSVVLPEPIISNITTDKVLYFSFNAITPPPPPPVGEVPSLIKLRMDTTNGAGYDSSGNWINYGRFMRSNNTHFTPTSYHQNLTTYNTSDRYLYIGSVQSNTKLTSLMINGVLVAQNLGHNSSIDTSVNLPHIYYELDLAALPENSEIIAVINYV